MDSIVDRVIVTKGRTGLLRLVVIGGNNEVLLTSQRYRDRHVERLAEQSHRMFPSARIFVKYAYLNGSKAEYEMSFDNNGRIAAFLEE